LSMRPLSPTQVEAITVSAWRLPPPFDLLLGLFTASGLSLSERSAAVAWYMRLRRQRFQCPTGQTVVELMSGLPPAVARLWSPLCTATLNTPPVRASAQVFARVLQLAFEDGRGASDFLAPVIDLSELMPEAAARAVESHGGHVHTRSIVRITGIQPGRISLASGERRWHKPQVIIAVGPHQLASLFDDTLTTHSAVAPILACVKGWSYEPITTVYLGYGDAVAPPAHIARLDDQP